MTAYGGGVYGAGPYGSGAPGVVDLTVTVGPSRQVTPYGMAATRASTPVSVTNRLAWSVRTSRPRTPVTVADSRSEPPAVAASRSGWAAGANRTDYQAGPSRQDRGE